MNEGKNLERYTVRSPATGGKEDGHKKEDAEVSRPLLMRPAAVGITGGQGIKEEDHSGEKHAFQLEVAQSRSS